MEFTGEHLRPGQLGHFFVITSFIASLFSAFSYFRAVSNEQKDMHNSRIWQKLGRYAFFIHTAAVISIFGALYYIITNHLFEYHYAWEHSSRALPMNYLLACFWEGQQGSFMLWAFWHCVLGLIVMKTAKGYETRTMAVIATVQAFLATMILGIYLAPDIKVGSTPFMLLRNAMRDAPIFSMPNYLDFVKDGNGLNVSLQNYWMVIHPPVLFLGFALTLIPFAYVIAALWKGDYKGFIKPTLAWSLVGGAVLGTGIMMGGAWAYESLNFGGYWAWDPVENASLVPWLTFIAGLHTLLSYRSTGRALTISFVLLLITHLLVWYSTFLTRTGILGETSVHAFTGDGKSLTYHLLIVIAALIILAIGMMVKRWRGMPRIKTEEETISREFWLFIGSVILFLSSIQIIITTSIPVWSPLAKWISGKDFAPPIDPMKHYNSIQVWVAIIIGLLSAVVLYMRYKKSDAKTVGKRLGITALIALVMAFAIAWGQKINTWQYDILLFAACYGIVANIYYGIAIQKGRLKNLGPSVAHLGFATVLLGILLSSYNKHAISFNVTGEQFDFGKRTTEENIKENMENVLLFRGVPMAIGEYTATYLGDSDVTKESKVYYNVHFVKKDSVKNKIVEDFMISPDLIYNNKGQQGRTANPSTKHYWNRDIFGYINGATDKSQPDTSSYKSYIVNKPTDTIFLQNAYMVFTKLSKDIDNKNYKAEAGDLAVAAGFKVYGLDGSVKELNPVYIIRNKEYVTNIDDTLPSLGIYARFSSLLVQGKDSVTLEMKVKQKDPKEDFVVLKILVFPYINVLWLGMVVMVFGFFVSLGNLLRRGSANPVASGE
jgi:cytochrome c-type biogenesis protein CcmF